MVFNSRRQRRLFWLSVVFGLALLSMMSLWSLYRSQFTGDFSTSPGDWGTFGDFMGGALNPLLSFLALGALLWTIHLQTEELEETRKEAAGSRKALEGQLFDGQITSLLQVHVDLVASMGTTDWRGSRYVGRECFDSWVDQFDLSLEDEFWPLHLGSNQLRSRWNRLFKEYRDDLLPFFRNVSAILGVIERRPSGIDGVPVKEEYLEALRSFLSLRQLHLLWLWRHTELPLRSEAIDQLLGPEYKDDPFKRSPFFGVRGALLVGEDPHPYLFGIDFSLIVRLEPKPGGPYPRIITAFFPSEPKGKEAVMDSHYDEYRFPSVHGQFRKLFNSDRVEFRAFGDDSDAWKEVIPASRPVFEFCRDLPYTDAGVPASAYAFYREIGPTSIQVQDVALLIAPMETSTGHRSGLFTAIQEAERTEGSDQGECENASGADAQPEDQPEASDQEEPGEAGASSLGVLQVSPRTGDEPFHSAGTPIGPTLRDLWSWSFSDLVSNASRGIVAEYIVAMALGVHHGIRSEWDAFDLETPAGIRVEVKSSAYVQTWHQEKPSRISFGIPHTRAWDPDTNTRSSQARRQAEVYVFCLLAHRDQGTIDPMDASQWSFFVLATSLLEERLGAQATATLSTLEKVGAVSVVYEELAAAVRQAVAD